ncbi:hypothetical protein Tco_0413374 [Tanacetum coccineum]
MPFPTEEEVGDFLAFTPHHNQHSSPLSPPQQRNALLGCRAAIEVYVDCSQIDRYEVGESSTAAPRPTRGHGIDYGFIGTLDAETRRQRTEEVGYRIRDVWVDLTEAVVEVAPMTLEGVNARVTELAVDSFHYKTARLLDQGGHKFLRRLGNSVGLKFGVQYEMQAYRTHLLRCRTSVFASRCHCIDDIDYHVFITAMDSLSAALGQIRHFRLEVRLCSDREGMLVVLLVLHRAAVAAATPMTIAAVEYLIEARVSAALANHEILRNSTNGQDDGSHNSDTGIRGTVPTPHECTYKDFLNCKPLSFKGTEGVVVLSQWFKKMESVFHISNYVVENQVKFATCTFLGNVLTWWNSHMKIVTQDVAYVMDWKAIKKMMTVKDCPGELALMCGRMFHEESDKVKKYVGGLLDMIQGNVMSYQPKTMEKAIEFANDQMDKKVLTIAERQAKQKRKLEFNAGNN